ncbi:MAG: phenylalanine--tRNA ligase subunit alpha [Alphaproteobacteria bacterium]|nr:phenylalanine--tRNA ligase subunit alpha [Alphaproteobacteria bacterium]
MTDDLNRLRQDTEQALAAAADMAGLEAVRVAVLGRNGRLTALLKGLGAVPAEQRKERGGALNLLKDEVAALIEARKAVLESHALDARLKAERVDVTLPARPSPEGLIHPISRTIEELVQIFGAQGFSVAEGPDIEDDWKNFTALNIPEDHPARQEHDTFYLPRRLPGGPQQGTRMVLRTHTSPVQIRAMLGSKPPLRVICPGRTYRSDHDATHSPMFHQVEGLVIDRDITMAHLKGCLVDFLRAYFGVEDLPVRFRPSFFPFTEPSAEVDIGCSRKDGQLVIGAGQDWLEILGCGMVHPRVLAAGGIDPNEWQGFAFGMGLERITMLKYGLPDLRPFFESDIRWLRHYGFAALDAASLATGIA